ncbi:hypothetical protein [Actinomycetospora soli]|uniref:hypothetical protein n=1 Tax=Actinomycetospora soli TaxID=2893887 RepID=UPI001E4E4608|nr:hypothetical protein [Actinomycetospora soli]MCD2191646.1 hypothetical protein [Actinomycetospora soli]
MTPEQDPRTAARSDDPAAVATARATARTKMSALATLENSAATGGTVTATALMTARTEVDLALAGIEAATRQNKIDREDARRATMRQVATDARALARPNLGPLLADVAASVAAYRAAVDLWDSNVQALTRTAIVAWAEHDTDVPEGVLANASLGGLTPPRDAAHGTGGLNVDGVGYGWTGSPTNALAEVVKFGATLPAGRIPKPVNP